MNKVINPYSWDSLKEFATTKKDPINGPNNAQSRLRLFGTDQENIRVIFYRDNHAWCPYCQKIWLFLEWKRIPYKIKKVTMRCYGEKERWYLEKVPSGLLPAIELDGMIITESDEIIYRLEKTFGPLGRSLIDSEIIKLRRLERELFRAWCNWLCLPSIHGLIERTKKNQFLNIASQFEEALSQSKQVWLDPVIENKNTFLPGCGDVIFIPYLERMNASLAYYKGFFIRKRFNNIDNWFKSLEKLETYIGTQGDFHTHAHDLPPQMGRCCFDRNQEQKVTANLIDIGEGIPGQESHLNYDINQKYEIEALTQVVKHKENIIKTNPLKNDTFDQPLRAALTNLITKKSSLPNKESAIGLRYLRDRISVPRDMSLLAARKLRQSLELTADLDSPKQGPSIPLHNRFDQIPINFI